jgi:Putative DNA-binding domain
MTTFALPLDQVTAAHLNSLVTNAVGEGRQLEYKEQLPIGTDDEKREFLADVTSFANTLGGDLIYGVRETRDAAKKPTGVPEKIVGLPGVNIDQLKLTLDSLLRDAVDPRMTGVALHTIPRGAEPPCLLVRAPKTTLGLHMVTFKGLGRFYGRATSGRYVLDTAQIRDAFVAADTAVDRVRRFRRERVAAILSGDTPIPVGTGPKVIFHLLPLAAPADTWARFPDDKEGDFALRHLRTLEGAMSLNWRYNLDGFVLNAVRSDPEGQSYTQLFRTGGIEAVSQNVVVMHPEKKTFHGGMLEVALVRTLATSQSAWETLGVTGPIMAALTLTGIRGATINAGPAYYSSRDSERFTVDLLNVPDVVIQDAAAPPAQALKPLIDIVWNAGGTAGSPFYNQATGEWKVP